MGNKTIEKNMPPELTCKTTTTTLFVCHRDICEIVIGNDLLSTTVLQVWNLYLHHLRIERRNATIYGFLDLVIIQSVGNKSEDVQKYLIEMFEKAGKEVYLAPYLRKGHWQLLVIVPDRSLVVLLCSLHKKANTLSIKNILEASLEAYSRLQGVPSVSRKNMQITTPNCRRQLGSYECGYYVMKHMHTIICTNITESWNKIFNDSSSMEVADIEDIRRNWASFILSVSRNLATLQ
ncbi:hypothetical protein LR48_Vigan04g070800 [Vigna angularis]|uniref:Ubiquitin-like protease family profile domain-containing protein n=1 Tax=Phaseolus angularis TaxID=3914 RepID=A0A0L9UC77_PHAAN|nr:hypothetical protein LR48_Vigan04g070800 [Vigna angularis]